jgi:hypothetical protein
MTIEAIKRPLGTESRSGVEHLPLGSVTADVMKKSRRPVIVSHPADEIDGADE